MATAPQVFVHIVGDDMNRSGVQLHKTKFPGVEKTRDPDLVRKPRLANNRQTAREDDGWMKDGSWEREAAGGGRI